MRSVPDNHPMNVFSQIIACAVLACSSLCALAQEPDAAEEKGKTYRATLFGTWEGYDLYTRKKSDYLPLRPAKSSYTRPLPYKDDSIVLHKKEVSEEGEESYPIALSVPVPAGLIEPLVILAWDRATLKPVAKVVEFSPRKFRFGSYQIVNFSNFQLGGFIGDKRNRIVCMPGESRLASFEIENGERAPIVFFASIEGEAKKVFGSITIHRERKRSVYLMYPQTDKLGRLVFQASVIVDVAKQGNQ